MQKDIRVSTEREGRITEKASQLSEQIRAKCMTGLIDQVKALVTSAQIVIPIKEVRVILDISITTGLGTRAGASKEITIPINPNLSDIMEEKEKI